MYKIWFWRFKKEGNETTKHRQNEQEYDKKDSSRKDKDELNRRDKEIKKNREKNSVGDGNWTVGVLKGIIHYNMKENKKDNKKDKKHRWLANLINKQKFLEMN